MLLFLYLDQFTFKTNANVEPPEWKDVFVMRLDPKIDDTVKAYRGRIVDPSMGKVEISSEAATLSVRKIANLHVRVVKKVRFSKEGTEKKLLSCACVEQYCVYIEYRQKTKFSWTGDAESVVLTGSFNNWQTSKILEKRLIIIIII